MWLSDKPVVQHQLAEQLASLVHELPNDEATLMFLSGMYDIMNREWTGLDFLRYVMPCCWLVQ
jgi:hypothetical protein